VPFLRLTRDRRGFENTFLLHADHPGAKARLLYWYRTAPGIALGRPALDEDAIRTIEENHPDIEFDWPAILALSEVMTPEEETPAPKPQQQRRERKPKSKDRRVEQQTAPAAEPEPDESEESAFAPEEAVTRDEGDEEPAVVVGPSEPRRGLVDELAGREIARMLRARYSEIKSKIDRIDGDRAAWLARAEAINPDAWHTPEAVLQGVSNADAAYEKLKKDIAPPQAGQE
jgi:hypothetical protein